MKKKIIFALVALIVIIVGSLFLLGDKNPVRSFTEVFFSPDGDISTTKNQGGLANNAVGEPSVVVVRTVNGYEPKEITIHVGDIVEWKNETDEYHWPASDLHPTHGIYPEFDPLDAVAPGQSWKFKFEQVGVWKYHDHIRANKVGTVTVQ